MNIKKLNKELNKLFEASNREWSFDGKDFKEEVVDTKEVELVPGIALVYDKVEHWSKEDGDTELVHRYDSWELNEEKSNTNQINYDIQTHVGQNLLGITDNFSVGASSGAVPLSIKIKDETYKKNYRW